LFIAIPTIQVVQATTASLAASYQFRTSSLIGNLATFNHVENSLGVDRKIMKPFKRATTMDGSEFRDQGIVGTGPTAASRFLATQSISQVRKHRHKAQSRLILAPQRRTITLQKQMTMQTELTLRFPSPKTYLHSASP